MPRYKTVVIDFPWPINTGPSPKSLQGSSLKPLQYKTMTLEEIKEFDIEQFTADDCQLFLWVTTGKVKDISIIRYAFDVLEHWGFTYHQLITWVKTSGFCVFSPIRSVTEHVIYAYRGHLTDGYSHMTNAFTTSQQTHSEKPARFYQLLRAWTPEPRIDIFARRAHEGFDGWGNEYVGDGPLQEFLK